MVCLCCGISGWFPILSYYSVIYGFFYPHSLKHPTRIPSLCLKHGENHDHTKRITSPYWGHKMAVQVTVHTGYASTQALCKLLLICHDGPTQWKCIQLREKGMGMPNKRHNLIHLKVTSDPCCLTYVIEAFWSFWRFILPVFSRNSNYIGITEWCSVCCW